jgi:hypothetical protein
LLKYRYLPFGLYPSLRSYSVLSYVQHSLQVLSKALTMWYSTLLSTTSPGRTKRCLHFHSYSGALTGSLTPSPGPLEPLHRAVPRSKVQCSQGASVVGKPALRLRLSTQPPRTMRRALARCSFRSPNRSPAKPTSKALARKDRGNSMKGERPGLPRCRIPRYESLL